MARYDETTNSVSMYFVYSNYIIGQITMGLTKKPVQLEAREFLGELSKAASIPQFKNLILSYVTEIADSGRIFVPDFDELGHNNRKAAIAQEHDCTINEDLLSTSEKKLYIFNQRADVKKIVQQHKDVGVEVEGQYLKEKVFNFITSSYGE